MEYLFDQLLIRLLPRNDELARPMGKYLPGRKNPDSSRIQEEAVITLEPLSPERNPFPVIPGQPLPIEVQRRKNRLEFKSIGCRAEYDLETRTGRIHAFPDQVESCLDNFLRVVYSYFVSGRGGFLLHSCGLFWQGTAYLLFGPSGSGKSTSARLFQDLPPGPEERGILSDDLVQILPGPGGKFMASQSPLEINSPPREGSWPVGKAFRLVKDRQNNIRALEPSAAVSCLLANIFYVSEDPETVPDLLDILEKFVRSARIFDLHFQPHPEIFGLFLSEISE